MSMRDLQGLRTFLESKQSEYSKNQATVLEKTILKDKPF